MKSVPLAACLAFTAVACSKDPPAAGGKDAGTANVEPSATASAASSASATAAASASASASPGVPNANCPKGSTGEGTFNKPCDAKGKERMMEATWTGKTDEKGPHFRVVNKAAQTVLYGKIVVYYYDKAGKQLEVKDASGGSHPFQTCGGNIFSGVMKPQEKAVITFSCVDQKHVPDGTNAIEAEIAMVGFADSTEKKSDLYWKNDDLSPEARKKGAK